MLANTRTWWGQIACLQISICEEVRWFDNKRNAGYHIYELTPSPHPTPTYSHLIQRTPRESPRARRSPRRPQEQRTEARDSFRSAALLKESEHVTEMCSSLFSTVNDTQHASSTTYIPQTLTAYICHSILYDNDENTNNRKMLSHSSSYSLYM